MRRWVPRVLILLFCPLCLVGQQPDSCLQTVLVNVVDKNVQQVKTLTAAGFRGTVHGQPVKVVSAQFEGAQRRIVILLDESGSMREPRSRSRTMALLALDVVANSQLPNHFALVTFSERVRTTIGFEKGNRAVIDFLRAVPNQTKTFEGRTALWDSIAEAVALFGQPQPGDLIYVVTDGGDNASKQAPKQALALLLQHGIRLFAFLTADERPRTEEERLGPLTVEKVTRGTGGTFAGYDQVRVVRDADWERQVLSAGRTLFGEMQSSYLLQVELPQGIQQPMPWKLEAVDPVTSKKLGKVHYPSKLFCSNSSQ